MRKTAASLAILVLVAVGGYLAANAIEAWRTQQALAATRLTFLSLPDALAAARLSHRPVLVDVSTRWCAPCRLLVEKVFPDARVKAAIIRGYELARVEQDAPGGADLIRPYGVTGFPTLLVLDEQGRLLKQLPVTFEPARFLDELAAR